VRLFQISCFSLLSFLVLCFIFPERLDAQQKNYSKVFAYQNFLKDFDNTIAYHSIPEVRSENDTVPTPSDGGIREVIQTKFQQKYQKWKDEFLTGEYGRQEWEKYSSNKNFILTITVASEEGQGAGTGEYKWNDAGELVEATITLGNKLDRGFPNPIYFPVMNSLSAYNESYEINGNIVAAAKFAHEFGHVNSTAKTSSKVFRLQNSLMPTYNKILLDNGYNVRDQRLLDLVNQMGGTPVEIWENREYWGETNAMRYLLDRINKEDFYCSVFNKIESNVKVYAKTYQARFDEVAESKSLTPCHK
jgi:hypothetical protein